MIWRALWALPLVGLTVAGMWFWRQAPGIRTIEQLLTENTELKTSLTRLTQEEQIGYAKVLDQHEDSRGRWVTRVLFVETEPGDPLKPVLQRSCDVIGDVIHFDALIVKFTRQMVLDGQAKAIVLWRRIYGEFTEPNEGFVINPVGSEPARYHRLAEVLRPAERELFWSHIWDLANDPNRLRDYGIEAIYGNVVYQRLEPGLIYVFKLGATGTLYPEVVPDL